MLLGDAGLGTEVETGVRPAPGPGAATDRNPVRFARAGTRMTANWQCAARAGGVQLGNLNSRSIAWKRGSLRKGSKSASVFR